MLGVHEEDGWTQEAAQALTCGDVSSRCSCRHCKQRRNQHQRGSWMSEPSCMANAWQVVSGSAKAEAHRGASPALHVQWAPTRIRYPHSVLQLSTCTPRQPWQCPME